MDNSPEIVPTPWTVAHYKTYSEIQAINGNHVCYIKQEKKEDIIPIGSFIVTACNNYQALKEENEELTTQLAKANSDKERLGELLKLWAIIKAEDITIMKSQCPEDEQGYYDVLHQCEISYNNILQTLQDCGITL
jgi:hypothetical protein